MGYLSATAQAGKLDLAALMMRVIGQGGPGGYRQVVQILRMRLQGYSINIDEYYTYGLWRKAEGRALLRELLTARQLRGFNRALAMPSRGMATDQLTDKLATETILRDAGLPTTRTLACHGGGPIPADVQTLTDRAAVAAFLSDPAHLPVFGKPRADTYARGAVAITAAGEDGTVTFLDGTRAPVVELAQEITWDWTDGYLFQPFYPSHPDLARHIGPAMASLRIVTVLTDLGVEPYYAVLRIPAKKAMHDGDHSGTRVWGLVDMATGALTRLRNLRDPVTPDITHWMDSQVPLLGLVLPHWPQALADVCRAHACFPAHGILGWDVFLTPDAALINEANNNPGHVYQAAAQRGLRNADLDPIYARALAYATGVNRAAPAP